MWKKLILKKINKLSYRELMEVLDAVRCRWSRLYPDWDIVVLNAPKNDPEKRRSVIEKAFSCEE